MGAGHGVKVMNPDILTVESIEGGDSMEAKYRAEDLAEQTGFGQGVIASLLSTWIGAGVGQFVGGKEATMWGSVIGSLVPLGYYLFKNKAK